MIGAAAAYMAGLFFASILPDIPSLIIFGFFAASALAVSKKYKFKTADYALIASFFLAALLAFFSYSALRYEPAKAFRGSEGSFKGEITDIRRYSGEYSNYTLKGHINGNIPAKVTFYTDFSDAEYGDIIEIKDCLFDAPSSDYYFNGESYYRSDGVFLTVSKADSVSVQNCHKRKLRNFIVNYRNKTIADFRAILGRDSGDLLAGMVFGEKHGMDDNVKVSLYRCGIGHILAVSGLHVSVAVLILMLLLRMLKINRIFSFFLMELLLIFMTCVANYPVSAVRAAIMMNFFYAAKLFRRQNDTFNSLSAAVLLIYVIQPYAIYDEGFMMSIAGTLGIGVFAPFMTKEIPSETFIQKFFFSFATMLCTTICVLPFTLMFFDETSLLSPVSNILLVPLCSVSMIIGLLYVLTAGVFDLLFISDFLNRIVLRISDSLTRLRFSHFPCGSRTMTQVMLICAALVIIGLAIFRNRKYTCILISASLVLLFVGSGMRNIERSKCVIVTVLGKGSNAAVVVSSGYSTDIIDINGNNKSASYVRKYLVQNGNEHINNAVITHKVQSSYASYINDLEYIDVKKWNICSDTSIAGAVGNISYFTDDSLLLRENNCTINYSEGILTINGNDGSVTFVTNDKDIPDSKGLVVRCGSVSGSSERDHSKVIYLDEENNFEIVLTDYGSYDIRRL